jgi:hypothetical protein
VERWTQAIPTGWVLPAAGLFLVDAAFSVYTLRAAGNTDALRWYDHLRVKDKR